MLDGTNALRVWRKGRACEEYLQLSDLVDEHYEFKEGKEPKVYPNFDWMRDTIGRICPKTQEVLLVPIIKDKSDDSACSGFCRGEGARIAIKYNESRSAYTASTLYHELMHAVDEQLNEVSLNRYFVELAQRGAYYGDDEYLDKPTEKLARAFEHFACGLDHGLRFKLFNADSDGSESLEQWMYRVYSGSWAQQIAEDDRQRAVEQAKRDRHKRIRDAVYELTGF